MTDELKASFNAWYLDDGSLGDAWEIVVQDLRLLTSRCKDIGLQLYPENVK